MLLLFSSFFISTIYRKLESTQTSTQVQQSSTKILGKQDKLAEIPSRIHKQHIEDQAHSLQYHKNDHHLEMHENDMQASSMEEKERPTHLQATDNTPTNQGAQSTPSETFWVDAGANGDGTSETTPAGNITYVLNNKVASNDIIKVKPEIYNASIEQFPLNFTNYANVTLKATHNPSETIIKGNEKKWGIKATKNNIKVRGFSITNCQTGIHMSFLDNGIVENNHIRNNSLGAFFGIVSSIKLRNNCIKENYRGIMFQNGFPSATVVKNNEIVNNTNGLLISSSTEMEITGNIFNGNNVGYEITGYFLSSYNHNIENNTVNGEQSYYFFDKADMVIESMDTTHITFAFCKNITVTESIISDGDFLRFAHTNNSKVVNNNLKNNTYGLYLDRFSYNNCVKDNTIHENRNGIFLMYSHNNTLTQNQITSNNDGIYLEGTYNIVWGNQITNNTDEGFSPLFH